MSKTIKILCQGAATLPLEALEDFQGDLKKIGRKELDKLKSRIKGGFKFPFYIWDNSGTYKIIAGHQRRKALVELQAEGYEVPPLPVVWITAKTEAEARQAVLEEISQYGDIQADELEGWLDKLDQEVAESLRFLDREIELGGDASIESIDFGDGDNLGEPGLIIKIKISELEYDKCKKDLAGIIQKYETAKII